MIIPKLQNSRCFVLQRCSTKGQADTSLNNQTKSWESIIEDNHIDVVGREDLPGVTGSIPGARSDIDRIINLKKNGLAFDYLLLPNTDRFTRAGPLHGNALLWDLEGAGITVYFAAENLFSDDRLSRTMLSFLFDAAQRMAMSISRGATMGNTNSYLEGRSAHSRKVPYGLDRIYSVDGKDMHQLRNLPDGTQQMLDLKTGEVIRTFGVNPKKGTPAHYIKQKNEKVRFVPGDPLRVATVHLIMQSVHVEGASIHSVAKRLNDSNIPSDQGMDWDSVVVKKVAFNPVYIGQLIRGRTTRAIYYKSAKGAPAESGIKSMELRESPRPPLRPRPYEEWLMREDPDLVQFLPEPIRQIAKAAIEKRLSELALNKPIASRSKDRHRDSDFFLKNILRSKQGNHLMGGRRSGRHGEKRYYRISKSASAPKTGNILSRCIPSAALETEMLRVLRETLMRKTDLKATMKKIVEEHAARQPRPHDRQKIEQELRRKQKQLSAAIESLVGDEKADGPLNAKLIDYRSEIVCLTNKLKAVPQPKAAIDVESSIERLAQQLQKFGTELDQQEKTMIHEMMKLLVHRMEADLLTKETEVELALPSWMGAALSNTSMMGLDQLFAWNTSNETHQSGALILARFRCIGEGGRRPCYKCHRIRKAA
jgi:hypothetical protein